MPGAQGGRITFTPLEEAIERLHSKLRLQPRIEEISTLQALGRVLAEEVRVPSDRPILDSSHMDGYALRAQDTEGASPSSPVKLKVVGRIGLGERPSLQLAKGEAMAILTGAFLPRGANAVVPKELVRFEGDEVLIFNPLSEGENVVPAGSDLKAGAAMLEKGNTIRAQDVGLLAYYGIARLKVFRKPRVGVLSIGSELVELDRAPVEGKTIASHGYTICSALEAAGAEPVYLGVVGDELGSIERGLRRGLAEGDMVMSIGGSSLGEFDLVEEAIRRLGCEELVHGLALQPGRVAGFGVVDGKPIFILPGLILSTINAYIMLAYPLIRGLLGLEPRPYALRAKARMEEELAFRAYTEFKRMAWVKLRRGEEGLWARPIKGDSSMLSIPLRADGYIIIQEGEKVIPKGSNVSVHLVPGFGNLEAYTLD